MSQKFLVVQHRKCPEIYDCNSINISYFFKNYYIFSQNQKLFHFQIIWSHFKYAFQIKWRNQYQYRSHFKITQDPFEVGVFPDWTNKNEKAKLHSWIVIIGENHLGLSVFKISCPQLERTGFQQSQGNYDSKATDTCEITETIWCNFLNR